MSKIVSIKKSGIDKYQIELDDSTKIKLYDSVILNNNLLFKKNIDDELLCKLQKENNDEDTYYKALNFISKKMHCKKEIITFLDKLDVNFKKRENIIKKLTSNHLINDAYYAKAYVYDKMHLSSDGPLKIKNDLLNNDIDYNVVENSLLDIDNEEVYLKAEKLVLKKIRSNSNKSQYALKQKILYDLQILGYDSTMINDILNSSIITNDNSIVSKEFYKLYRKLSNKYKDTELSKQIYYKLRQKGFSEEEISNINK